MQNVVGKIAKDNLMAGKGQFYKNVDDCKHQGNKIGEGVYCTPDPNIPIEEGYAGIAEANGEKYYMTFMLRVRPDKIRCLITNKKFWVLNDTDDEIRPYGILIKKVN